MQGLANVRIRAGPVALRDLIGIAGTRQRHDWKTSESIVTPEALQDFKAVESRQIQVRRTRSQGSGVRVR
jgi:hypothetical protein